MDTKKILYMTGGILVGGLLVLGAGTYASKGGVDSFGFGKGFGLGRPCNNFGSGSFDNQKPPFADKITKNVVNTASGAEITLTTTDSGALAFLQKSVDIEKNIQPPKDAKISVVKTKLDNGVKIVVSSSDAAEVTRIQERATKELMPMPGRGPRGGGFGMMGGMPGFNDSIKREVVNTASGIDISITTTDSGALAHVKEMAEFMTKNRPNNDDTVTVTSVDIENGVKVSITSTNADTVKKIQENGLKGPGMMRGEGRGRGMMGGGRGGMMRGQ